MSALGLGLLGLGLLAATVILMSIFVGFATAVICAVVHLTRIGESLPKVRLAVVTSATPSIMIARIIYVGDRQPEPPTDMWPMPVYWFVLACLIAWLVSIWVGKRILLKPNS
jgi:hypothetical protein